MVLVMAYFFGPSCIFSDKIRTTRIRLVAAALYVIREVHGFCVNR